MPLRSDISRFLFSVLNVKNVLVFDLWYMTTEIGAHCGGVFQLFLWCVVQFDCGGMVLEETPGKVCEAFRLFLQGMGYGAYYFIVT